MKEYRNIDELFRQELSGLSPEPSKRVWNTIESRFFAYSKGFIQWYHIAATVLVLVVAGAAWYYFTTGADESAQQDTDYIINESSDRNNAAIPPVNNVESLSETDLSSGQNVPSRTELPAETSNYSDKYARKTVLAKNKESGNMTITGKTVMAEQETSAKTRYPEIPVMYSLNAAFLNDRQTEEIRSEDIPGMQQYLEKSKRINFYTGLSAQTGMVFYPSAQDQFTWSADLAFGLRTGKFYFETGLGYEFMQERGVYMIDYGIYDSIGYYTRVESFEIDPDNPDVITYNIREVPVYDSIYALTYTSPLVKYRYVNIPLTIGYRFWDTKNFRFSINSGVIFHILSSKEFPGTDISYPEAEILRTTNATPVRVDWNLRWHVGLRMNYNINQVFSIAAEPVFTQYLNSIYDTGKGYNNVKPYTMGVRVGIYYGF